MFCACLNACCLHTIDCLDSKLMIDSIMSIQTSTTQEIEKVKTYMSHSFAREVRIIRKPLPIAPSLQQVNSIAVFHKDYSSTNRRNLSQRTSNWPQLIVNTQRLGFL